jgi:2-dehydropantoate 2-reductase
MSPSDVLIVGTGALACLFAARLSAAGISVLMLGTWPEGISALAHDGVRLVDENGRENSYPVTVTSDPRVCQGSLRAMVLVKSWQTQRAAEQLNHCLDENGLALTLQNGFGNFEALCQSLGSARVALGSTTAGAHLLNPGVVKTAGEGIITLGVHARLKHLAELLGRAGFVVESEADINSLVWGKLIINAAINPLTALLHIPNGELLNRPEARALATAIAREAAAVAVAKGIELPYPDPVVAVEAIIRHTANNYSSMLQDVRRGAPTEIDAICGAVMRAGKQTGVPTPVIRTITLLIGALVSKGE